MPIIYYDGTCGYCNKAVKWLIHHNIPTHFQFAQLSGKYGERLINTEPRLRNIDSIIVVDGPMTLTQSDAVIHLLKHVPGYRWLSMMISFIPKSLRDIFYGGFARIRHRIPSNTRCKLPTEEERKYFLD
ncbi:DUF393 domain-containing protein [Mammaliicoccus sp. Dog046]|uniref:thiol-disulfide oxidoreductase DCC family protein n=1 Tax=Mammaliicoccus sp. Dog046 TaxID=3034233 RepID=UPI002B25661E|nr:DUF393 domain-containing protein [Mammaliicoccus sp. Dog046]WQK86053.1 DUF393 domain-containing protein [Mammaliicoccus sp. Dog046]